MSCNPKLTIRSRYNLKRRVASLPPLSSEVFAEKVLTAQASSSAAAAKASFERSCSVCQKTYYSENAYQNHLGSLKHRQKVATAERGFDAETGSVMSSTFSVGEPIQTTASEALDPVAEEEFSKVVDGMKDTSLEEKSPVSRKPSRPHHSAGTEQRPEHPLSKPSTENTTPSVSSESTSKPDHLLSRCLFCNYDSPTVKLSVAHMEKFHGMFIPEQSYLVDLEGLLRFLYEQISENHECLFCHKIKGSNAGIQTHMRDMGHCMIAFDTEEDMISIGQFYDFTSTYSDAEDDTSSDTSMVDGRTPGGVKLPSYPKYKTHILDPDGNSHEVAPNEPTDADGWETDSSASSLDSNDLTSVPVDDHTHQYSRLPLHRHHSHTDPRPHKNADGFHAHVNLHGHSQAAFYADYELHLPNGRTLGHRSLARYFRQNLRDYPTPEERASRQAIASGDVDDDPDAMDEDLNPNLSEAHDISSTENRLMKRGTRNLGMIGASTSQRRAVAKGEKRDRKREDRARRRYEWGNEKRGNMQKHFRVSTSWFLFWLWYDLANRGTGSIATVNVRYNCCFVYLLDGVCRIALDWRSIRPSLLPARA
jgi:pre-60S factor REI1